MLFVDRGDVVLRVLGAAQGTAWDKSVVALRESVESFSPIIDEQRLAVAPLRIDVIETTRSTTLAQLADERPSAVETDVLELLNGLTPDEPIDGGQVVKWVTR